MSDPQLPLEVSHVGKTTDGAPCARSGVPSTGGSP